MKHIYCSIALIVLAITSTACAKTSTPQVETLRLHIGKGELTVEVARTPDAMAQGLMFRKSLPKDTGMLFVFPVPGPTAFWMKNTYVPLTIAYLDAEGKILELYDLDPLNETPVPSRSLVVAYAIEATRGWFVEHGVSVGASAFPKHLSWKQVRENFQVLPVP